MSRSRSIIREWSPHWRELYSSFQTMQHFMNKQHYILERDKNSLQGNHVHLISDKIRGETKKANKPVDVCWRGRGRSNSNGGWLKRSIFSNHQKLENIMTFIFMNSCQYLTDQKDLFPMQNVFIFLARRDRNQATKLKPSQLAGLVEPHILSPSQRLVQLRLFSRCCWLQILYHLKSSNLSSRGCCSSCRFQQWVSSQPKVMVEFSIVTED